MRSISRRSKQQHEEESVFVPMTDMTVSFLFIVMILLAFFAVQFSDDETVPQSVYEKVLVERNEFKKTITILTNKIETLEVLVNQLSIDNDKLKIQNNKILNENLNLKEQLEKAEKDIKILNTKVEKLELLLSTLKLTVDDLKKKLAGIKEKLLVANQNLMQKDKDIERLEEIIYQLNAQNTKLIVAEKNLVKEIADTLKRLRLTLGLNKSQKKLLAQKESLLADYIVKIEQKNKTIDYLLQKLKKQNPLEIYMTAAKNRREIILAEIKSKLELEFDNIFVEISPEGDALRFKGDGLFAVGSSRLFGNQRIVVERLGSLISEAITCYTRNNKTKVYQTCNPNGIIVEAVQIEGHTDSLGPDVSNLKLSTDRANSAFIAMQRKNYDLLSFLNYRKQPVISVAGYGEMRPVASNETPKQRSENRRIDIRLIMYAPIDSESVFNIKKEIFVKINNEEIGID